MSNNIIECIRKKDIEYKNNVFYLALITMVLKGLIAYSELIPYSIKKPLVLVGNLAFLFFLMLKIVFLQKYTIKQCIVVSMFGLMTFYTDRVTSTFVFLPDFLFIIATQDVDFKKIIRKTYRVEAVILLFHVFVYAFCWVFCRNIINFSVRIEADGSYTYRHQFLLAHANSASMLVLWTILGYLYAEYENLTRKKIICAWGIYVLVHIFTDSNSGLIILTVTSTILLIKKTIGDSIDNFITFLSKYTFIFLAVISNILMVIYTKCTGIFKQIWSTINIFFTGRLLYGAYAYDKHGFTLLGRLIPNKKDYWQGMWIDVIPCDNAYMWFSVCYGVVYVFAIAYIMWEYSKYIKFEEKVLIIAYSLYTLMELYVTSMFYAFPLIMIARYLWVSHEKKSDGNQYCSEKT